MGMEWEDHMGYKRYSNNNLGLKIVWKNPPNPGSTQCTQKSGKANKKAQALKVSWKDNWKFGKYG